MKHEKKIKSLVSLEDKIIATYIVDSIRRGAEDYAPIYRKYPKLFKQLVKSELRAISLMRKYFNEAADRAIEALNWGEFERRKASATSGATMKAGILDYLVQSFWEGETLVLKVYLTKALVDALEAGGLFTEEDLKVDVGWSRESAPAIDFLNKYSFKLAGNLTDTTKDRVNKALQMSIDNGEDREGAVDRIMATIKDPVRATSIAQTESVRAFSSGRMEVGRQIGVDRKRWRTAGASDFCLNFEDEGVVKMAFTYTTPYGDKITEPPGHPNCRCGIEIFMPGEKV